MMGISVGSPWASIKENAPFDRLCPSQKLDFRKLKKFYLKKNFYR